MYNRPRLMTGGTIHEQRNEHVLAMQGAVRAHVPNRFVPRPKIPVARRGQNDLARPRRQSQMHDLHDAVRIVRVDRGVQRLVALYQTIHDSSGRVI